MTKIKTPRWGWALTGSGHFFKECLRMVGELDEVDLFVSRLQAKSCGCIEQELKLPETARVFRDTTASAAPVGLFYYGVYHTLILRRQHLTRSPNSSFGISDTLVTNVFAQAGKCRVPDRSYSLATPRLNSKPKRPRVWSRFIRAIRFEERRPV